RRPARGPDRAGLARAGENGVRRPGRGARAGRDPLGRRPRAGRGGGRTPAGPGWPRRGHRLRVSGGGDGGRRGGGTGRRAGARAANRHGGAHLTMTARVTPEHPVDVVVVGGGNAALCAALAARETGARALLLEKA